MDQNAPCIRSNLPISYNSFAGTHLMCGGPSCHDDLLGSKALVQNFFFVGDLTFVFPVTLEQEDGILQTGLVHCTKVGTLYYGGGY